MPHYHRSYTPGGTYFFTVVTYQRANILRTDTARSALRRAFITCKQRWPFETVAIVLLDDHLHTIWTLPSDDTNYSRRWSWIKREFGKAWLAAGGTQRVSTSKSRNTRGERGVWQRRFWEHTIRNENDLYRHIDYIHYNPVRHGLVDCAGDYPYSSFHRYVDMGAYPRDWGCREHGVMKFDDLKTTVGE